MDRHIFALYISYKIIKQIKTQNMHITFRYKSMLYDNYKYLYLEVMKITKS